MNRCSISAMINTLMKYYFYIHYISKNKKKTHNSQCWLEFGGKRYPHLSVEEHTGEILDKQKLQYYQNFKRIYSSIQ